MFFWFRDLQELFTGGQISTEIEALPATWNVKGSENFGRNHVDVICHLLYLGIKFCLLKQLQVDEEYICCYKEM